MIGLNEACAQRDDTPGNHGDTENMIRTEAFDGHCPGNLEENVKRIE